MSDKPIRRLECCCCGTGTTGRQWWNRDTGYGLCAKCGDFIIAKDGHAEAESMAGKRGIHWDIADTATTAEEY